MAEQTPDWAKQLAAAMGEHMSNPSGGSIPPYTPDYPLIRRLEQDVYGEWFTLDGLDRREQERMRPGKVARMFEVEQESANSLRERKSP